MSGLYHFKYQNDSVLPVTLPQLSFGFDFYEASLEEKMYAA